jgi:hypothetical protein
VELNPSRIQTQAGDPPVEAVVRIQNLSNVLEQYTTEIVGLDPAWYSTPETSVGLFPQDREEVRISFHPPKQPGLRAGAYPFQVRIRARGGLLAETVDGVLDVRGNAVYRMDLVPRRQTGRPWRSGRYRLRLTNVGSDVRLKLEAKDPDQLCKFRLANDEPALLAGGSTTDIAVRVQAPVHWVGLDQSYDFLVSARPQDARGDPQMVPGQYILHPLWPTWWQPIRFVLICVLVAGLLGLVVAAFSSGWTHQLWTDVLHGYPSARGWVCQNLPFGLKTACPATWIAPVAEPTSQCTFQNGFRVFQQAEQDLVGDCMTNEVFDEFGNSHQFTTRGELVWVKGSNTIYFIASSLTSGDYRLWGSSNGVTRVLDDPGAAATATPTPTPSAAGP